MTPPRNRNARPPRRGRLARILIGPHPADLPPARPTGHRYRCGACKTTYGPAHSRAGAEALRAGHRRDKHGGGVPDGEEITSPPPFRLRDIPVAETIGVLALLAVMAVMYYVRNH